MISVLRDSLDLKLREARLGEPWGHDVHDIFAGDLSHYLQKVLCPRVAVLVLVHVHFE